MLKDVQLRKDGRQLDWSFKGDDLDVGIGNQQIKSAIIHAVLLCRDELEMLNYYGKGCLAYDLLPVTGTDKNRSMIEEAVNSACVSVDGVRDARSTVTLDDGGVRILDIVVTLDDGSEVKINEI